MAKLLPLEQDFCRDFNVPFMERNNSKHNVSVYKTISNGCHILNELFLINALHIINLICSYLNWTDIARAAELVNFQLLPCLQNPKILEQIFFNNTQFFRSCRIIKLNYTYLLNLDPKELFYHYHSIYKTPKFQKFENISLPFKKSTDNVQFHPFLPAAAVHVNPDVLLFIAYDIHSILRRKCYGTGLLAQKIVGGTNSRIISMDWSPQGNFLSVITVDRSKNFGKFDICNGSCYGKQLHLFHLDVTLGQLTELKTKRDREYIADLCVWHQTSHIWNDDHIISYYNHQTLKIHRIILDAQSKQLTQHILKIDPWTALKSINQVFACLASHPNHPHKLIFVGFCSFAYHYHHRINIYNLVSETVEFIIDLPGLMTNFFLDPFSNDFFVAFSVHPECLYLKSEEYQKGSCNISFLEDKKDLYAEAYRPAIRKEFFFPVKDLHKCLFSINIETKEARDLLFPRWFLKNIYFL